MTQPKPVLNLRSALVASCLAAFTIFSAGGCELAPELDPGQGDDDPPGSVGGFGGVPSADDDGFGTSGGQDTMGTGGETNGVQAVCGNGKVEPGELCDDKNTKSGDGCSSDCSEVPDEYVCLEEGKACIRVITCGNGVIEGTEKCDDKNTQDKDGCSGQCDQVEDGFACIKPGEPCVLLPVCGNGERERGEQCDDGAEPADEDGCDSRCQQEDGFFCPPGEACVELDCGDGFRTPDEACDDGDGADGDGCSASCEVEVGWYCSASGCKPICGDGLIRGTEQCDDNDKDSGDGCSAACRIEPFWECGEADGISVCTSTVECGNGEIEPGEICDPGVPGQEDCFSTAENPTQACKGFETILPAPDCGNGVIEFGEECDGDGGLGGCDDDCAIEDGFSCPKPDVCVRVPRCGDGFLRGDEACDPGATSTPGCVDCVLQPNYFCSGEPSDCVASICGDGVRAPDEQCDDPRRCVGGAQGGSLCSSNSDCPGGSCAPQPAGGDGCSATCTIETGYVCPPGANCQADCGDGLVRGSEECDTPHAGCLNCRLAPGYDCGPNGTANPCTQAVCGNGIKEAGEGCDPAPGDTIAGDGCGPSCQLEPVFSAWPDPVIDADKRCGDGIKLDSEGCDDGNKTSGDGCSATCAEEDGWNCSETATYPDYIDFKVTYRDFKHRNEAGGHPHMRQQGVSPPQSGNDFGIVGSLCTAANQASCGKLDSQGKPSYVGSGTHNTIDPSGDSLSSAYHQEAFRLWYRDTNLNSAGSGTVNDALSESDGNGTTNTAIQIAPNPGLCTPANPGTCSSAPAASTTTDTLRLGKTAGLGNPGTKAAYQFSQASNIFYPLGDSSATNPSKPPRGFGYTQGASSNKNWNWTSELRYYFQYQGGETLTFFGDDDVWVFVNGRLAVDIGGIHGTIYGRVVLGDEDSDCTTPTSVGTYSGSAPGACSLETSETTDDTDGRFGITKGQVYEIVVFQAERHPTGSNYQLTLDGFIAPRSTCNTTCGDGIVAGSEVCDTGNGSANGGGMPSSGYDTCLYLGANNPGNCKYQFCGDGVKNGGEYCDNGLNIDTYETGAPGECAPGCLRPSRCGDGFVQPAEDEECDLGTSGNTGEYGGCTSACKFAPYCGDGTTQTDEDETCDPADGVFGTYGPDVCGYDCKAAPFCGDLIRNGPEVCDGSANCNPNCEFDPFCGDGLKTMDEACDFGNLGFSGEPADAPYGGCTTMCELGPRCGDELTQTGAGEECDDGPDNVSGEYDACTTDCLVGPHCGDGVTQTQFDEACDNGFNEDVYQYPGSTGACGEKCKAVPRCGDGKVQSAYELCDNGSSNNDSAYNGCTTICEWGPYCGDGKKNGSEDCDNGSKNVAYAKDGNGCSFECKSNVPYCGDGVRNGPELCDLGTAMNTGGYGKCNKDCTLAPFCGDRIVQRSQGEECDDGPTGSLDCSPKCDDRTIFE